MILYSFILILKYIWECYKYIKIKNYVKTIIKFNLISKCSLYDVYYLNINLRIMEKNKLKNIISNVIKINRNFLKNNNKKI